MKNVVWAPIAFFVPVISKKPVPASVHSEHTHTEAEVRPLQVAFDILTVVEEFIELFLAPASLHPLPPPHNFFSSLSGTDMRLFHKC